MLHGCICLSLQKAPHPLGIPTRWGGWVANRMARTAHRSRQGSRCCHAVVRLAILVVLLLAVPPAEANVHTVFTTECGTYFTWQALGMVYSHKKSGQPGKITRLMSCTDQQWEAYPDKDLVPTHRVCAWILSVSSKLRLNRLSWTPA